MSGDPKVEHVVALYGAGLMLREVAARVGISLGKVIRDMDKADVPRRTRGAHNVRPIIERFWEKVMPEPNSGCWLWMAASDKHGYGRLGSGSKLVLAHRFSYELHNGPIPSGLQLDHLCRVPACVNPAHLEPVTPGENVRRGNAGKYNADKTHCKRGHPLSGGNLRIETTGSRRCRACLRLKAK